MTYATLLKKSIDKKGLSLTQICFRLAKKEIWLDRAVLSKVQNGKLPPAKDEVNIVLAEILEIDSTQLRIAAVKAIMPDELFKLIKATG